MLLFTGHFQSFGLVHWPIKDWFDISKWPTEQIHLAFWTNTFGKLDKYIQQIGKIHFGLVHCPIKDWFGISNWPTGHQGCKVWSRGTQRPCIQSGSETRQKCLKLDLKNSVIGLRRKCLEERTVPLYAFKASPLMAKGKKIGEEKTSSDA